MKRKCFMLWTSKNLSSLDTSSVNSETQKQLLTATQNLMQKYYNKEGNVQKVQKTLYILKLKNTNSKTTMYVAIKNYDTDKLAEDSSTNAFGTFVAFWQLDEKLNLAGFQFTSLAKFSDKVKRGMDVAEHPAFQKHLNEYPPNETVSFIDAKNLDEKSEGEKTQGFRYGNVLLAVRNLIKKHKMGLEEANKVLQEKHPSKVVEPRAILLDVENQKAMVEAWNTLWKNMENDPKIAWKQIFNMHTEMLYNLDQARRSFKQDEPWPEKTVEAQNGEENTSKFWETKYLKLNGWQLRNAGEALMKMSFKEWTQIIQARNRVEKKDKEGKNKSVTSE
eukprot:Platyproteum_vivax@DN7419_c0_g1_i1.p1